MNTRRALLPAQPNGSRSLSSGRVGARLRTSGDNGTVGHGLTHHAMALVVGTAVIVVLSGCRLCLRKGFPTSLLSVSASETARDGLARQAVFISSIVGMVAQVGGEDATTTGLAEGVKQTADIRLEALGGVWQPRPSQAPSAYPIVAPAPSASADASVQDLAMVLVDGSTLARHAAIAAASEQDARLFTSLMVAWSLQHDLFQPLSSADKPWVEVAQSPEISSGLLISYDAARYAMEEFTVRSDDSQRTRAIADAKVATSAVNTAVAAGSEDKWLGAYAALSESTDPSVDTQVLWARQVWSVIVSSEVQEAGSAKASSPARKAAATGAVDVARRATVWGASFSSLPGYAT